MNTKAQRIAIAETCGWTEIKPQRLTTGIGYYRTGKLHGVRKDGSRDYFVPNYLNDLNAMHFAEQFIRRDHDKWGLYLQFLNRTAPECRVHATAAQKAEAFLRAIGKWEEGK